MRILMLILFVGAFLSALNVFASPTVLRTASGLVANTITARSSMNLPVVQSQLMGSRAVLAFVQALEASRLSTQMSGLALAFRRATEQDKFSKFQEILREMENTPELQNRFARESQALANAFRQLESRIQDGQITERSLQGLLRRELSSSVVTREVARYAAMQFDNPVAVNALANNAAEVAYAEQEVQLRLTENIQEAKTTLESLRNVAYARGNRENDPDLIRLADNTYHAMNELLERHQMIVLGPGTVDAISSWGPEHTGAVKRILQIALTMAGSQASLLQAYQSHRPSLVRDEAIENLQVLQSPQCNRIFVRQPRHSSGQSSVNL